MSGDEPTKKRGSTVGSRTLLRFVRPYAGVTVFAAVLAAISSILELAPFYILYLAVVEVYNGGGPDRLVVLGLAAGIAAGAQTLTWSGAMYVSHIAAYAQLHRLRVELLDRFTKLPLGQVSGRHSGDLQRVVVDDVFQLEVFVSHSLPEFVSSVVTWLVVTTLLIIVDLQLAVAIAIVIAVGYVVLLFGSRRSGHFMAAVNGALARMSRGLVELFDGLLTLAVLDRSRRPPKPLAESFDDVAKVNSEWIGGFAPFSTGYLVLVTSPALLLVPVGGALVLAGDATAQDFLLFLVIGLGYGAPIIRLRRIYFQLNSISYAAGVIDDVLSAEVQSESAGSVIEHANDLAFEGVSFAYDSESVLHDISFNSPQGSLTAIVGPTGAGKSTIGRLAARFWDVDAGSITLGGIDVREMPIDHLMSQISFVFQDTFLFRDTIRANLLVGNPAATDADMEAAAQAANIHEMISGLSDGYETMIGSRGATLSGGQRQRLAIARALLHDAPVVVLDEATAFVDPDSEAVLRDALHALTVGRTVLVIAHRLSTVVGADQILVMDGGRIVQRGTHDELLVAEGKYLNLWRDWERTDAVTQ